MKVNFHQDLSPRLTIHIDRWIKVVRPMFSPKEGVKAFWLSDEGNELSRSEVQRSIKAITLELVGHALTIKKISVRSNATSRIGDELVDDQYELNNGLAHDDEDSAESYEDYIVLANAPRRTVMIAVGDDVLVEPTDDS